MLVSLLSLLSGCVYLRLLRFKNQLKHFDQKVRVVSSEKKLGLEMLDPVLLDTDFVFITDSQPTRIESISTDQEVADWIWLFEKQSESEDSNPFSIEFRTRYKDSLFTRVDFDPKLLDVIPSEFVVAIFKSFGKAKINKLRKNATAEMNRNSLEGVPLPSLQDIKSVMGKPTRESFKRNAIVWHYTFVFRSPDDHSISGQFKIAFKADSSDLSKEISGFLITAKGA